MAVSFYNGSHFPDPTAKFALDNIERERKNKPIIEKHHSLEKTTNQKENASNVKKRV